MRVLEGLQRLDDRVLRVGRWIDRLPPPADRDAMEIWSRYDEAERANARRMAAWRNVATDPELALVVAGLVDRVLEERARNAVKVWVGFGVLLVGLLVLAFAFVGTASSLGGLGGPVGVAFGWSLQLELYDRARRRNLEVARAVGLR